MRYVPEQTLPLRESTNALAFSPDGARLALATRDKQAHNLAYQVSDWSPLPAPRFARYDLCFGADGALVVAGVCVERFTPTATKLGKSAFSVAGHPKGLTRVEVSPDGRWLAVHKHLDRLELWFVGGSRPERHLSVWSGNVLQLFFSADSARFFHTSHGVEAGRSVDVLHQIALDADGRSQPGPDGPMPEGLSVHDIVRATPHGLVAVPFALQDVVVYDWDALRPRRLGVRALQGNGFRAGFAVASDATHLAVQIGSDRSDGTREWTLTVVALPTGEEVGALTIGIVSAGLIALSARAERIAFTRVDTDRELRVFRRDDGGGGDDAARRRPGAGEGPGGAGGVRFQASQVAFPRREAPSSRRVLGSSKWLTTRIRRGSRLLRLRRISWACEDSLDRGDVGARSCWLATRPSCCAASPPMEPREIDVDATQ